MARRAKPERRPRQAGGWTRRVARAAPRLALALLLSTLLLPVATSSLGAKAPKVERDDNAAAGKAAIGGSKAWPPPAQRGRDVADTHARLRRLYKRLGVRYREPEKADGDAQGCAKKQRRGKRSRTSSRRFRLPAGVAYVIIGVIVVGMLIPLIIAWRRSYRDARDPEPELPQGDDDEPLEPAEAPWEVSLDSCRELARRGELAAACAALHRHVLLRLADGGHLTLAEATTNWAYVRKLASKARLRSVLAAVTIAAERSVLGGDVVDLERYSELERRVREEVHP